MAKHYHLKLATTKLFLASLITIIIGLTYFLIKTTIINKPKSNNFINEQLSILNNKLDYQIVIDKPMFEGYSTEANKYTILANQATKDGLNHYLLDEVIFQYYLNSTNLADIVKLTSNNASLKDNEKILKLIGNVHAFYDDISLRTNELVINLPYKQAYSDSKTILHYKNSEITAHKFSSTMTEKTIYLDNDVFTKIRLQDF